MKSEKPKYITYVPQNKSINYEWLLENFGGPLNFSLFGFAGPGWHVYEIMDFSNKLQVEFKLRGVFENKEHATLFKLRWA